MEIEVIPQHILDLHNVYQAAQAETRKAHDALRDKIKELYPKYERATHYSLEDQAAISALKHDHCLKFKAGKKAFDEYYAEAVKHFPYLAK